MGQPTTKDEYAQRYAENTFCIGCRDHKPVGRDGEFVWSGTNERVGT